MTVDMSKIRQAKEENEIKQASFGGGGTSLKFYKFQGKEARLRFLPPWTDEGDFKGQFWREVGQHWGINEEQKGPILCPKKTPFMEGECPICEFVNELRQKKNDLEALELAKEIRAKTAYFFTIIDRADPEYTAKDVAEWKRSRPDSDVPFEPGDPKLQVYAAPFTVYNALINIFANGGDIVDLEAGHDIIISRSGSGIKTKYSITPDFNKTEAGVEEDHPLLDLSTAGFVTSYDDMAKVLEEGIGGEYSAALPSGAVKSVSSSAAASLGSGEAEEEEEDDLEAEMRKSL